MEASGGDDGSKGEEDTDPRHSPQPGSDGGLANRGGQAHSFTVTITARVHNHQIVLPANVEVAEGAEVQVTLPDTATDEKDGNPMTWMLKYAGTVDSLPPDAAERHNELAHGRKRRPL